MEMVNLVYAAMFTQQASATVSAVPSSRQLMTTTYRFMDSRKMIPLVNPAMVSSIIFCREKRTSSISWTGMSRNFSDKWSISAISTAKSRGTSSSWRNSQRAAARGMSVE
ncbi:hypothetical protein D3C75_898000 [compost metagenome]